jgi:hypothetical protein
MKRFGVSVLSAIVALLLVSCTKPLEEKIQQAESALEAAEAAGARIYAPDDWMRANEAMEKMKAELSVQEQKFRLFRNFNTAGALAMEAVDAAGQAKAEAERKKTQLRSDVTGMIAEVRSSLRSAHIQLSNLSATAAVTAASMKSKLVEAEGLLDKAQSELGADRFDSAMASAGDARDRIVEVLRAIERAAPRPAVRKR